MASKKQSTAVVPVSKADLARYAADIAAHVETGAGLPFFSTRAGRLAWQGNEFRENRVHAVLLGAIYENTYYPGRFDAENPVPPTCYAFGATAKDDVVDGLPLKIAMVPHDSSAQKQNADCARCKWNAFKTDERGKGKACKNRARLALLPVTGKETPEQIAEAPVGYLRVSPLSVIPWSAYVTRLATSEQLPPFAVVTTITTVPDPKAQFLLSFTRADDVDAGLLPAILARRASVMHDITTPYPTAAPQAETPTTRKRKY